MKIHLVELEFLYTDKQKEKWTDIVNFIDAFATALQTALQCKPRPQRVHASKNIPVHS
jgi:hypothetical protein